MRQSASHLLVVLANHPADHVQETTKPPILFIHGSYHGAWCFKVKALASGHTYTHHGNSDEL